MDGLLLDTEQLAARAHLEAAKQLNLNFNFENYCDLIGVNHALGRKILSKAIGSENVDEFLDLSRSLNLKIEKEEGIGVKPGVKEILDYCDAEKIPRRVATSTGRKRATRRLKKTGIYERIDGLVCGDEVKNAKPHPEIFLKALGNDVEPAKALIFEDSYNGLIAAKAAGIPVICIPDLLPARDDLEAEAVLSSLHEAIPYLEERKTKP